MSDQALLDCVEINTSNNITHSIIWMHGLGADANDFVPIVPELRLPESSGIRFVFPNAPVRPVTLNNGMSMRAWFDIISLDRVNGPEDEAGLRQAQQQIEDLITRENERGIPSENIFLAGFSQGCAMALLTGLRHPKKLAGLICLSGFLPLLVKTEAERSQANIDTPIFMAHGTEDPVVVPVRALNSKAKLEELGYKNLEWRTYPMPHSVCLEEIHDISSFIQKNI
ncbi:MAG: carboxylesterase [Alcaligenaceae bacterium]|nr:carboxylesterase [Alcaligenaceae bacterium]